MLGVGVGEREHNSAVRSGELVYTVHSHGSLCVRAHVLSRVGVFLFVHVSATMCASHASNTSSILIPVQIQTYRHTHTGSLTETQNSKGFHHVIPLPLLPAIPIASYHD